LVSTEQAMVIGSHWVIPTREHGFCVQLINKKEPGKELQPRHAFRLPNPGEGDGGLQVLKG
jgi:hypothetical protein